MVSSFALCGMPFLAGFYSRDFILEMFSMRYVNMFGFLIIICVCGFNGHTKRYSSTEEAN